MTNPGFWSALETLLTTSELVIDRPRGTAHPCYPDLVYPLDYGYLADTRSMDGGGIDVWRGTASDRTLVGIIVIVDLIKRDSEIKLLLSVTEEEIRQVHKFYNNDCMKGLLIRRA